jgi:hypothetical protein
MNEEGRSLVGSTTAGGRYFVVIPYEFSHVPPKLEVLPSRAVASYMQELKADSSNLGEANRMASVLLQARPQTIDGLRIERR